MPNPGSLNRPLPSQAWRGNLIATACIAVAWLWVCAFPFVAAFPAGATQSTWILLFGSIGIATITTLLGVRYLILSRRHEIRTLAIAELRFLRRQYEIAEGVVKLGSWIMNLQTQEIWWTRGTYDLYGYEPAAPIPSFKDFLLQVHPDDRALVRDARMGAVHEGKNFNVVYRFQRHDGQMIWVRSHGHCEKDQAGKTRRIQAVVRDITDSQHAFATIQDSEAKFKALADMGSDWYWETDQEHRFTWISSGARKTLGLMAETGIGKRRWDLPIFGVDETDWQRHRDILEARLAFEGFSFSIVNETGRVSHATVSGRPFFNHSGEFLGYRGVARDITEERSQEILLQIENGLAHSMHQELSPAQAVTNFIRVVCEQMGWAGGSRWYRQHGGGTVARAESFGNARYMQYLAYPDEVIAVESDTLQAEVWRTGKAHWVKNLSEHPGFTRADAARRLGFHSAFYIPIVDRQTVISVMVFLSTQNHEADQFIYQVAEVTSRSVAQYLQRRRAEERLLFASTHDALTNLPNRAMLIDLIEKRLAQIPAPSQTSEETNSFSVFFIDLDRYKNINDTLGHEAGDDALRQIARRLTQLLRTEDVVARVGGDEFVVVVPSVINDRAAEAVARRILREIELPLAWHDRTHSLSASIGVAIAPRDGRTAFSLIKNADTAMYRVKSTGRNGIQVFNAAIQAEREDFLRLETELDKAIEQDQLQLYYQPVIDIASGKIIAMEGLARWPHAEWGFVAPTRFIPVAEESNLIARLGDWSIRRACLDHLELRALGLGDIAVSVNLSAKQLNDPALSEHISRILRELQMPPEMLRLELTESAWMRDPERAILLMRRIQDLGVRLVIDDFGTGYSSLAYVKNLPVTTLKIDRAFITGLPQDSGNAAIVQSVITLCERLNLQVIAEGVETSEQLEALRGYQCHAAQGFFIGKPMPLESIQHLIRATLI
ncbi:EAL and GGDEF domain-containing protein [Parvibium lacunae]|uniref:EAL domain-containing protein n=1 Tax=Parvibium lacunae TaxID=1888893 RepID=A0A368L7L2_9BURK|nr:EAL domain-containing protein [Parvibium lacunae]RCS59643.1 EAL domain-containing protein [Parvibium lacunae]